MAFRCSATALHSRSEEQRITDIEERKSRGSGPDMGDKDKEEHMPPPTTSLRVTTAPAEGEGGRDGEQGGRGRRRCGCFHFEPHPRTGPEWQAEWRREVATTSRGEGAAGRRTQQGRERGGDGEGSRGWDYGSVPREEFFEKCREGDDVWLYDVLFFYVQGILFA